MVGPTRDQLVVFDCSSIPILLFLSSLFSVIGRALSGSTGCFRFLQYFSVDLTLEFIFRHLLGPLGIKWLFSFVPVLQCCCYCRVYFFVIGRAHSGSTGCFRFLQYFNVDVTVETIFSSLVGSTWFQLAVFVWSSISDSMLLSSQFPVIVGPVSRHCRAHSGSTGCSRLLQYFIVDVTVESIFRHWSGQFGFNWQFPFAPVIQC